MPEETHTNTELVKRIFIHKSNIINLLTTLADRPVMKDIAYMEELVLLIIEEERDVFVLKCMVGIFVNINHERGSTNKPMVRIFIILPAFYLLLYLKFNYCIVTD